MASDIAGLTLDDASWDADGAMAAVVLNGEQCELLARGQSRVVLARYALPDALCARPLALVERTAAYGLRVVGMCEASGSRRVSASEVAALDPLADPFSSPPFWGWEMAVRAQLPEPSAAPPMTPVRAAGSDAGQARSAELYVLSAEAATSVLPLAVVTFTLEPDPPRGRTHYVATFRVRHSTRAPTSAASLAALPVGVRGGSFELTAAADDALVCSLDSANPRATAGAIASRLCSRVDDPSPPGMEAACALM